MSRRLARSRRDPRPSDRTGGHSAFTAVPSRLMVPLLALALVPLFGAPPPVQAQNPQDTRLLADPAVSADHVAFLYDGDLWLADRDGSSPRRVTTHRGDESDPRFSPDGGLLAFTGEYDGNTDVFVVPVDGGAPERLTWHPGDDEVLGFTPGGSAVLFRSQRAVHTSRHHQLFTVSLDGGMPDRLPVPNAFDAAYSPDGSKIAYNPLYEAFREWKNYRGGTQSRIWIYDVGDHSVVEIPKPEGGSNDTGPMWIGDSVYFLSDRAGEFDLFSYDPDSEEVTRLTDHADFPVVNASAGDGTIVYEQAGWLHMFDPTEASAERLPIGVATDLVATRPRYVSGIDWIRDAHLSPSAARAVFEFRGDVVTVPREKGDPRPITSSSDAHERSPVWSPDGHQIAYFSDASGEYELHVAPGDGEGEVRSYALDGAGHYEDPKWSPDGTMISFTDNSWSLYVLTLASGQVEKIAQEGQYGPLKTLHHAWSPDSRWLAYTLNTETYFGRVYLHSLETGESTPITDGLSDVHEPTFDRGGEYLYFFASTDAGPVRQWFAQSNNDMEMEGSLYLAVLQSGTESPLKPRSDEETGIDEASGDSEGAPEPDGADAGQEGEEVRVEVDFEDLDQRMVTIPTGEELFSDLQAGAEGRLYYLRRPAGGGFGFSEPGSLSMYDLEAREETTLLEGVTGYTLNADASEVLARQGDSYLIADASQQIDPSETEIPADEIELRVDPRQEWRQIYNEVWRINRDWFYDPGMHGADWDAVREKYAVFLPHVVRRGDLNRVMRWMGSEVAVGHHRGGGGDFMDEPESVPGGLLGADYEVADGRYRFARVYGGLNWNPDLRSPLTEPGVEVEAGEYLLAVEGVELRPPENLYSRFENSAGQQVEITVGPDPEGSGSRTVTVVPVESEGSLRNRDWVEGNIDRVTEATDGRVAYVYVPNTAGAGHEYFKRYFFPQADREAIIVDERYNGGGQLADYYIDLLDRPYVAHWNTRYGDDIKTPIASIQGPKVMIIDETAGSGGDLLPWMFRKYDMGTIVGKRTWGGLVGILGFPTLLDGGSWTAPNLAIWTPDGGWVVENVGVPPDIEVEQLPAEVVEGRDPQLERAIREVMDQLPAEPPAEPEPPAYPNRADPGG